MDNYFNRNNLEKVKDNSTKKSLTHRNLIIGLTCEEGALASTRGHRWRRTVGEIWWLERPPGRAGNYQTHLPAPCLAWFCKGARQTVLKYF
jgi:hypothetical protein